MEEMGIANYQLRVTNYEFQFCLFFLLVRILFDATAMVLPFRQGICTGVFVRRSLTYGYEGCCLSGKGEESEK